MKTTQSFRIHFVVRAYKAKDGKAPLYVAVTVNKEKCLIGLKENVDLNNWDADKGAPKGNRDQVKKMTKYLDEVRLSLGNCYKELTMKGRLPTAAAVKNLYLGDDTAEGQTLSKLFTYHHETAQKDLKWSTLKHYDVTQRYLFKFIEKYYKTTDIYLRELNFQFIKDFESFLRNLKHKDHQQPLNNNGVMKHIIRLRKMVTLAQNLGWVDGEPFAGYKLKFQRVNREFLSKEELKRIKEKKFDVDRLDLVRDLFLFSCYTGLAYVEVANLLPQHIIEEGKGELWIRTVREKTLVPVDVPMLPQAQEIYRKYRGHIRALDQGKVFPIISNQKVNSYLKEIADRCDIFKKVTFHLARHTFATTIALSNGVPIETVSKLLGHTKIATTQIYAKVLHDKVRDDMQALKEKISQPAKRKANRKSTSNQLSI